MGNYRRIYLSGGWYFFTVVTYQRQPILCEEKALQRLKQAFKYTQKDHPFKTHAIVILPDHLHCIWQLPDGDSNFSARWNKIKRYFSIGSSAFSNHRREKNIWQRRFWEHVLRDEKDLKRHLLQPSKAWLR
ncbi:MAG: hypothetical protein K0S08_567 [Gammaproteobacteria bacterium]|jgi:putative transposase|nr:hypothetical protein [Gammaproteobacteria bacterium]